MSLPRYPEYKDSRVEWLSDVPTHWTVMPIRLAARLESGHTPSRSRPDWWEDCSVPWFTLADVSQIRRDGADVIYDTKEKVSEIGLQNSSARRLPAGTVMLSRTASVGFAAIMGVEMATTQDFANWVCGPSLRPRFLLHVFRAMRGEFARLMMGSTHNTIYMPDIAALRFALPPVEEQDAVVGFLDRETAKIDSLITEQEKLIFLLAEKRQATISQAVTKGLNPDAPMKDAGVAWLGEVPSHWRVGKIQNFARRESGHTPSRQRPEWWENCTIPWFSLADVWQLRTGNVKYVYETKELVSELGLANSSARLLPAGTVMLSRTASVGYSAIMGCAMATTQDFINWVCKSELAPEFLLYVLRGMKSEFDRLMIGSTHQTIYMPDVARLMMGLPPLAEQGEIVAFLDAETSRLDALTAEAVRAIDLLKERRSALIAAAVTGQIDVRQVLTC